MLDQMYNKTDIGKIRPHNEDAVKIYRNLFCTVMVVADGMGGHEAGDVASEMVINVMNQHFNENLSFSHPEELRKWIKLVLKQINQDILEYIEQQHISHGMGTTVVVTVLTKSFIAFAHAGDSRAYILTHQGLRQITKDHTFVRKLMDEGKLSEKEAKRHPHRNIIMNALGVNKELAFDYVLLEHYDIKSILLCTDGLTSLVEDQEIEAVLKDNLTTEEKVTTLIQMANENGGTDNISVALYE